MPETICEFIVLVEASADYGTVTGIAEKAIREYAPEWLRDILELSPSDVFSWAGLNANTSFSCWADIKNIQSQFEIAGYRPSRFLGFNNSPGFDYAIGWKVLRLIDHISSVYQRNIPAVLFIRDADNQAEERLNSLNALREKLYGQRTQVIIGLAIPKREAWVLNGFDPQTVDETKLLQKVIREIQFNPCLEAHRLRGKINQPGTELRDIKRVLKELTDDNRPREEQCWQTTSLAVLITRGVETGLTDYIENVRKFMIPILTSQ